MTTQTITPMNNYYNKLLQLLEDITGTRYDEYIVEKKKEEVDKLDNIIALIIEKKQEIEAAKKNNVIFTDNSLLMDLISQLDIQFADYMGSTKYYYKIFLIVCEKIAQLDPNEYSHLNLDDDMFKLVPIDVTLKNFAYVNADLKDTVLIISLMDVEAFENSIAQVNIIILFYIINLLDESALPPESKKLCLVNKQLKLTSLSLKSFIELHEVSKGGYVHTPYRYTKKPSITSEANWNISNGYHQLLDSIYILSEYNTLDNILDKYLKLYQVIENFMYRFPISDLMQRGGADMFSIRHFKNLYNKVSEKEMAALKSFFEITFNEDYSSSISLTFKNFVYSKWQACATAARVAEINDFIEKIGCSFKASNVLNDNILKHFTDIVYQTRNSIVHNKETEYHLTYGNFTQYSATKYLLEEFLIVCLEEIVYYLMIKKNNIIWYNSNALMLFKEEI